MGELIWRLSRWDHNVHAFQPDMIGELTAEALCTHSALTGRLAEPGEIERECMACVLLNGNGIGR